MDTVISITGDKLTIRGEKKQETEKRGQNCYRMERRYGSFHRVLTLPASIYGSKVNATCKNGVLLLC
jgi:HSP20 family protein